MTHLKYALLTDWHVHTAGFLSKIPDDQCLYVWDSNKERGLAASQKYGGTYESDLKKVLSDPEVDGVIIEAATTTHKELILQAISHGKHIFVDKPMSTTKQDALEIKAALDASNCRFILSLESLISGSYRFAKEEIAKGTIGDVVSVYFRRAHAGVLQNWLPDYWYDINQTGGGVTLDLGCHGLTLLPYLCGKPKTIKAIMTEIGGKGIDDNSTTIMSFENNAIGTAYTSFVTTTSDNYLEIIGQKGSIIVLGSPGSSTGETIFIQSDIDANYESKTTIDGTTLPSSPYPIEVFSQLIADPSLPDNQEYGIDAAVELSHIIEQAYLSGNPAKI